MTRQRFHTENRMRENRTLRLCHAAYPTMRRKSFALEGSLAEGEHLFRRGHSTTKVLRQKLCWQNIWRRYA